jgi:bilirubin oxidase
LKIISRRKDDPSKADGRSGLEPYEKDAVKDLVLFGSNEVVEVLLKFQPYPGLYMW